MIKIMAKFEWVIFTRFLGDSEREKILYLNREEDCVRYSDTCLTSEGIFAESQRVSSQIHIPFLEELELGKNAGELSHSEKPSPIL